MSCNRGIDFDTRDALPEMLAELLPKIHRTATKLAADDPAMVEELVQEAAIELWNLDPTRFDAGDTPYVEAALFKHMHNVMRHERAASGGERRVGGL
jgi:DNA-directed RNA polymerase specialized sigma24 family protein